MAAFCLDDTTRGTICTILSVINIVLIDCHYDELLLSFIEHTSFYLRGRHRSERAAAIDREVELISEGALSNSDEDEIRYFSFRRGMYNPFHGHPDIRP